MTRTLIGLDSTGVGCIKITKDNYDPKTTSDSLRSRFLFNSKWKDQITTPEIEVCPLVPYSGTRAVRTPSGSTNSTFAMMRVDSDYPTPTSRYTFRGKVRYPNLRYDYPLIDVFQQKISNGRYQHRYMVLRTFGAEYGAAGVKGGYYDGGGADGAWYRQFEVFDTSTSFNVDYGTQVLADDNTNLQENLVVYNLPGNNVSLDGPSSPPDPSGKMTVQITSDYCRVAKPGYDVRTATPAQLAFDSSGRPLSVIAAADIAIPNGASSYDTGITLPDNCVVDMSCYDDTSSNIHYPMKLNQDEDPYGIEYWFDGSLIRFNNTRKACRARFIMFGADPLGPSSGSNRVMRQFTDGGENHVQLLRPGSSTTPRFSDIILDTRRPTIQIIDDGYIAVSNAPSNGVNTYNISYDASGFFPYIKYMTVHGSGTDFEVRCPRVNCRTNNSIGAGGLAGDGTYCKYNTTSATFYTARGTPMYRYYSASSGIVTVNDPKPILGIRYYVLGIPA